MPLVEEKYFQTQYRTPIAALSGNLCISLFESKIGEIILAFLRPAEQCTDYSNPKNTTFLIQHVLKTTKASALKEEKPTVNKTSQDKQSQFRMYNISMFQEAAIFNKRRGRKKSRKEFHYTMHLHQLQSFLNTMQTQFSEEHQLLTLSLYFE